MKDYLSASSDFSVGDFKPPLTIERLCNAIVNDNYNISIQAPINTINWLNELLKIASFHDILREKKPSINFSKNITDLVDKTKDYRNKNYFDLNNDEQNNIKRLNRLLLEETYPQETPKNHLSIASKIFADIGYEASEEDTKKLADNIALLEKRGLGKLNKRLIEGGRGIWATITEHNFAVILVSRHCSTIPISYEPENIRPRPPDFKVEIGDITYWIQVKDLSKLERENRQYKIIQQIERAVKEVKVGKFFSCKLSDDFKEDCLPELISFVKDKAMFAAEAKSLIFTSRNNQKAEINFWSARKIALSELTLGYYGDVEMVEITGLSQKQIKQSLVNAAGAFPWEVDERNINLVVIEADNKKDTQIYDALFGTEYDWFNGDKHFWDRKKDGLFSYYCFSRKVAGVITIKRKQERFKESEISHLPCDAADYANYLKKECGWTDKKIREVLEEGKLPGPIADYSMILYMNDRFKNLIEDIKRLLSFDNVVYYNMRPPMGNWDFKVS